jgi:hypothetical protein
MTKTPSPPALEPSLDDMLQDPVVLAVLRRDRLTVADVLRVVEAARARLIAATQPEPEPMVEPADA